MTLRNRNTKENFTVSSLTSVIPLNRQSIFSKSMKDSFLQIEQFIQEFSTKLPKTLLINNKEKILMKLRQEYLGKSKDIDTIINHPQEFINLIIECNNQATKTTFSNDSLPIIGFLKLLGTSLISAKLNLVFPGLALLAQIVPSAAQSVYAYYQGQPTGGEDLCSKALYDCIQGYLTEIGQEWKNELPQIARLVEQEGVNINNCVTQQRMQEMMMRAYRGPNELATNCTLTAIADDGGRLIINATQIDPITCDIMRDSLIGFTEDCSPPVPPIPSSVSVDLNLGIGIGLVGTSVLALLALGLYKYIEHRRHQASLLHGSSVRSSSYNAV